MEPSLWWLLALPGLLLVALLIEVSKQRYQEVSRCLELLRRAAEFERELGKHEPAQRKRKRPWVRYW